MKKRPHIRYTLQTITAILMFFICIQNTMAASDKKGKYTTQSPLTLVCETEFYPFEYRDDNGNPEGFNIKVATKILSNLHIPYRINMRSRTEANKAFYGNMADLIVTAPTDHIPGVYYTKTKLARYKIKIAYTKGKTPIKSLKELKPNDIVIFKEGNYCAEIVRSKNLVKPEQMMFRTVKQGLLGIATGDYQYMVGCEATLKMVMKKYDITNVELAEIDIPEGAVRFCSRDKLLINLLDDKLAEMEHNGQLQKTYQNAMSIQSKEKYTAPYILIVVFGVLTMVIIILLVNRYVTRKIRKGMQSTIENNNIMKKALEIININVLNTDLKKRWVTNIYGNIMPLTGLAVGKTMERIHPDDIGKIKEQFSNLINKKQDNTEYSYRYNVGTKDEPVWRILYANAIPEFDKKGNVISQITTVTDITDETKQDETDRETSEIYKHIFDMPIVGLALYDKEGRFIEANQVMRDIFKVNGNDIFEDSSIYDFPGFANIQDRAGNEELFFCTYSDATDDGMPNYVEIRMRPIKDDNGEVIYRMITARDKTDEREMYHQSRLNDEKVRQVSEQMMQYENELRYLLKGSQMRVWKSNLKTNTIRLYRDLHTFDEKYTFEEFFNNLDEVYKERGRKLIDPRCNHGKAYNDTLLINDKQRGNAIWYAVNSIPDYDDKGNLTGCFGLIHNVNDLQEAQIKMRKEKERANDSSRLKSTFLANMSHEIRTPLNAIVGFCDLLHTIESPEEKEELLKIIHNNCNNLLQIINDILVLSELDSSGLVLAPEKCDFAEEFNLLAKSLEQRVTEPGVDYIIDTPYDKCITTIDKGRVGQVITNFLTNAVKYTRQGHIKLGYRKQDNGLYIYCEDTGTGIPKEKYDKIFERFIKLNDYIQGAGIGLSICKAIATKCNGKIGVESEEGKGSTFWMWIPCEIIEE